MERDDRIGTRGEAEGRWRGLGRLDGETWRVDRGVRRTARQNEARFRAWRGGHEQRDGWFRRRARALARGGRQDVREPSAFLDLPRRGGGSDAGYADTAGVSEVVPAMKTVSKES